MWDEGSYRIGEWAIISLEVSPTKFNNNYIDEINIIVKSDSSKDGLILPLTETEKNSGIFSGKIQFTSDFENNDSLLVKGGDSVYAIYGSFIQQAKINPQDSLSVSQVLVSSDKTAYKLGEIIKITGKVSDGNSETPVILTIKDSFGKTVLSETLELSSDMRFSMEVVTEGHLWKESGNYLVNVSHESGIRSGETVFSFSTTYNFEPGNNFISIFGTKQKIKYTMTAGELVLVRPNQGSNSLQFSINPASSGHLTIELPRTLIDFKDSYENDKDFIILVEGQKGDHIEKTSVNERTLTIPYTHKVKTIDVKGTYLNTDFPNGEIDLTTPSIPYWIKNNAEWWSKGLIKDKDFLSGIQFLINHGIMKVPIATETSQNIQFVPNWIKETSGWWALGKVSDQDFVNGIKFLVNNGIIRV